MQLKKQPTLYDIGCGPRVSVHEVRTCYMYDNNMLMNHVNQNNYFYHCVILHVKNYVWLVGYFIKYSILVLLNEFSPGFVNTHLTYVKVKSKILYLVTLWNVFLLSFVLLWQKGLWSVLSYGMGGNLSLMRPITTSLICFGA